jgi:hypothetical protein
VTTIAVTAVCDRRLFSAHRAPLQKALSLYFVILINSNDKAPARHDVSWFQIKLTAVNAGFQGKVLECAQGEPVPSRLTTNPPSGRRRVGEERSRGEPSPRRRTISCRATRTRHWSSVHDLASLTAIAHTSRGRRSLGKLSPTGNNPRLTLTYDRPTPALGDSDSSFARRRPQV